MQLSLDNIYISARLQKKLDRIPMYPLTTVSCTCRIWENNGCAMVSRRSFKRMHGAETECVGRRLNEFWRDFAELIGREAGASFSETLLKMGPPLGHYDTARIPAQDTRACARKGNLPFVDDYHLVEGE